MSLQETVHGAGSTTNTPAYYSSPSYNQAINTSRFVKGFGITALACSVLSLFIGTNLLLGGAIGLGVGLFIFRYDKTNFYHVLGIIIMAMAIIGGRFPFLNPMVISCAVLWKGTEVLKVLSREGQSDRGWKPCYMRTVIGITAGGVGLLVAFLSLGVMLIRISRIVDTVNG
jgi:hypothetical protein